MDLFGESEQLECLATRDFRVRQATRWNSDVPLASAATTATATAAA